MAPTGAMQRPDARRLGQASTTSVGNVRVVSKLRDSAIEQVIDPGSAGHVARRGGV